MSGSDQLSTKGSLADFSTANLQSTNPGATTNSIANVTMNTEVGTSGVCATFMLGFQLVRSGMGNKYPGSFGYLTHYPRTTRLTLLFLSTGDRYSKPSLPSRDHKLDNRESRLERYDLSGISTAMGCWNSGVHFISGGNS